MSLRPVRAHVLFYSMLALGVTNGREREQGSQVSGLCVCLSLCVCVCVGVMSADVVADDLASGTSPPFIVHGVTIYTDGEEGAWGSGDSRPPPTNPMVGPVDLS